MATKTYIGQLVNLVHYKGASIRAFEFEIVDANDAVYDLTIYDYISLKIFAKQHGTVLKTFSDQTGELAVDTDLGVISWDASLTAMDLRVSEYYYFELRGRLPGGKEDILLHGPSEVI